MEFSTLKIATLAFTLLSSPLALAKEVAPLTIDGAKSVTTAEAKALFDKGVLFIDVRKDRDWNAGRIPDSAHINSKTIFSEKALLGEIKKSDAAVIYCNGEKCLRSSKATIKAVAWGFTNLYYYRDGYPAWKKAGYPTE